MNLPMRQNKKRNQALDAFASLAKTWSEWRLGERASQTVAKGTKKASKSAAKARKNAAKAAKNADASSVKKAMKGTPLKVAGAVALVGGVGAAVAKKLKGGGGAEPLYTPPAPPAPTPAAPDMTNVPPAPPTGVVVGDLAVATSESVISAAASSTSTDDLNEPTVPDTDPPADDAIAADAGADADGDGDGDGDSGDDAIGDTAVTAAADGETLEAAPAGDAHDDDIPTAPGDDPDTPAAKS